MIYEQDTIPFPVLWHERPTFQQFRKRHGLSYFEIAVQAQVHYTCELLLPPPIRREDKRFSVPRNAHMG